MRWARNVAHMRNVCKILIRKLEVKDHFEDLGMDGMITLKWILKERGLEGVDCIYLVQDRERWWALENMVMNLRIQ
jgi:hypothetical protein